MNTSRRLGFTRLRPTRTELRRGFTLVELILTISIIIIIAASVFASIDPVKRLNMARNSRREADITILLDALKAYQADNDGAADFIDNDKYSVQIIGEDPNCNVSNCSSTLPVSSPCKVQLTRNGKTISEDDVIPGQPPPAFRRYLPSIPIDPRQEGPDDTRYYVNIDNDGIVTVGACDEEPEGRGGTGTAPVIEREL